MELTVQRQLKWVSIVVAIPFTISHDLVDSQDCDFLHSIKVPLYSKVREGPALGFARCRRKEVFEAVIIQVPHVNMCKQGQFQTSLGHVELGTGQSRILG